VTLMTYTNLVATKGTAGSIANWVNYQKLEAVLPTILEEAQALLYSLLRVREMQTTMTFKLGVGSTYYALPTRFQDPIGDLRCVNQNFEVIHKIPSTVRQGRSFSTESGGPLAVNPFTTVSGSSLVTVAKTLPTGSPKAASSRPPAPPQSAVSRLIRPMRSCRSPPTPS
jgi:hypothetical protein